MVSGTSRFELFPVMDAYGYRPVNVFNLVLLLALRYKSIMAGW